MSKNDVKGVLRGGGESEKQITWLMHEMQSVDLKYRLRWDTWSPRFDLVEKRTIKSIITQKTKRSSWVILVHTKSWLELSAKIWSYLEDELVKEFMDMRVVLDDDTVDVPFSNNLTKDVWQYSSDPPNKARGNHHQF